MEKITYVSMLTKVINGEALSAEEVEKAKALRESVAKKSARKAGSMTKTQKENVAIKDAILRVMREGVQMKIAEITKAVNAECGTDYATQKISALVKQLKEDGLIDRQEIKREAYFTKVSAEAETEVEVDEA